VIYEETQGGLEMTDCLLVGTHTHGAVGGGYEIRQRARALVALSPVMREVIAHLFCSPAVELFQYLRGPPVARLAIGL
jgi:hypothetical protein